MHTQGPRVTTSVARARRGKDLARLSRRIMSKQADRTRRILIGARERLWRYIRVSAREAAG